MPHLPTETEFRPVLLGIAFDVLTLESALDRIFELALGPQDGTGCRLAATVNVDFIVNTYFPVKNSRGILRWRVFCAGLIWWCRTACRWSG